MRNRPKIDLTDTEWLRLIDGVREDSALPICCGNVSTLRDSLISAVRNGGEVVVFNQLEQHLGWCFPDHDPSSVILKVARQLEVDITGEVHKKDEVELT